MEDYYIAKGKALIEWAVSKGEEADLFSIDQRADALLFLESLSSEEQVSTCDQLPRHIFLQLFCRNRERCRTYALRIKPFVQFEQEADKYQHLIDKIAGLHRDEEQLEFAKRRIKDDFVQGDIAKGKALIQRAVDEANEKGEELATRYTIEERVHIFAYLETLSFEHQEFELERLPDELLLQLYCSNKQRPEEQARKIVYLTRLREKAERIQHLKAMLQDEIHRERAQERYENRWRGD